MTNINDKSDIYNQDYINFQNWNTESFGELSVSQKRYYDAELKKISKNISKNSRVLEIGFGNGLFLQYAKTMGWNIQGIEVNINLVKLAQDFGFNANYAENLTDINADTFDLIVAFDVLEHIPQTELEYFFPEIKRILRLGGIFLARFPNADSPFSMPHQNGDVTHVTSLGSGKVQYFALKANLELIFCGGSAEIVMGENLLFTFTKCFAYLLRRFIDLMIYIAFYKRKYFTSENMTIVMRKQLKL